MSATTSVWCDMEIVVNDANIFIDLHSVGLLDAFFSLPLDVHTVDFVVAEISNDEQKMAVERHIEDGSLTVRGFNPDELSEIVGLQSTARSNLSFPDCSVWYYARKYGYALLTGDGRLRRKAEKDNVTVRGILYVFDLLVEEAVITPAEAADKLDELMSLNPRLPRDLVLERIRRWRIPNATTLAAMEEARSEKMRDAPELDLSSIEAMEKSMGL